MSPGTLISIALILEGSIEISWLFISIFALGRVPGWTLNVAEQYDNNILLRPRLEYVGPMDLDYKDIDSR